jgi:hypothetical protein
MDTVERDLNRYLSELDRDSSYSDWLNTFYNDVVFYANKRGWNVDSKIVEMALKDVDFEGDEEAEFYLEDVIEYLSGEFHEHCDERAFLKMVGTYNKTMEKGRIEQFEMGAIYNFKRNTLTICQDLNSKLVSFDLDLMNNQFDLLKKFEQWHSAEGLTFYFNWD